VRGRIAAGRKRHGRRFVTQHVTGHKGRSLDGPLPTITCQDQLAVVDGNRYRPLTVRETARGMGFPDHYGWPEDTNRRDQIRGLGNAVCPPVAECIVRAVASHVG
jgi:DNA (cytosine-5)-methyltransferase 1